jgi:serine/threonine protein phosphatase PrpC
VRLSLSIEVAGKTDVGCVRVSNEDSFGYDLDRGIFVVCDGMGGHASGEVASRMAVESLLTYFRQSPHDPASRADENGITAVLSDRALVLEEAIQVANMVICKAAGEHEKHAGMGSTIVCALVEQDVFSVGHVGDSRAYLIREDGIQQLTQDHSLVARQTKLGLISPEDAKKSALQNVITQALGSENTIAPDVDDLVAVSDDVLLLASDGLTGALSDEEIMRTVNSAATLGQACENLVQAAKLAGGRDNITCLLVRFVDSPWYQTYLRGLRSGRSR